MERIVIPHPMALEHMRGLKSLASTGRPLAVRFHDDDIDAMYKIADKLGMRPGALMRWCVVYAVRELYKQHFNEEINIRP